MGGTAVAKERREVDWEEEGRLLAPNRTLDPREGSMMVGKKVR